MSFLYQKSVNLSERVVSKLWKLQCAEFLFFASKDVGHEYRAWESSHGSHGGEGHARVLWRHANMASGDNITMSVGWPCAFHGAGSQLSELFSYCCNTHSFGWLVHCYSMKQCWSAKVTTEPIDVPLLSLKCAWSSKTFETNDTT